MINLHDKKKQNKYKKKNEEKYGRSKQNSDWEQPNNKRTHSKVNKTGAERQCWSYRILTWNDWILNLSIDILSHEIPLLDFTDKLYSMHFSYELFHSSYKRFFKAVFLSKIFSFIKIVQLNFRILESKIKRNNHTEYCTKLLAVSTKHTQKRHTGKDRLTFNVILTLFDTPQCPTQTNTAFIFLCFSI